jgi:O-antigen ligase
MQTLLENPGLLVLAFAAVTAVLLSPFRAGWLVAILAFYWADSAMPGAETARRTWFRIAVLLLVGLHGAIRLRGRGTSEPPPTALLLLVLLAAVSLLWAEPFGYPAASAALLVVVLAILFGLVSRLAYSPQGGVRVMRRVVGVVLAVIAVGLIPWGRTEGLFVEGTGRLRGFFSNPNGLGITCALCAPWVAVGASRASGRRRAAAWTLLAALVVLSFLSGSRTGFGGVVMGSAVALFVRHPSKALAGIAAFGLLVGLATAVSGGIDLEEGAAGNLVRGQTIARISGRLERWELGLEMWRENPVLGAGYMTSRRIRFVEARDDVSEGPDVAGQGVNFHSQYVETLVDQGVVGELLLLALGVTLFRRGRRLARADDPDAAALGASWLGLFAAVALDSFFHNWILTPGSPYGLVFWSATAVVARVERALRAEPSPASRAAPTEVAVA